MAVRETQQRESENANENALATTPLSRPRYVTIALWVSVVLFLALVHQSFVYAPDDAFITFRYSQNLANGHGPVFNAGMPASDRAEGYSCPLYMLIMAVILKLPLGLDILLRAKLLGLLCGIGVLIVSQRLAERLRMPHWAQAVLPLCLAAHASISINCIDGMETILAALLTTSAALTLCVAFENEGTVEPSIKMALLSGLLFAGVALNRPEGALMGLFTLIALLVSHRREGARIIRWSAGFLVPVIAWFVFRRLFYGVWLPNTYYAKAAPLDEAVLKGATYLLRTFFYFLNENLLYMGVAGVWWMLVLAGATAERFRRMPGLVVSLLVAAQIIFALRSGGDWMGGWRYMAAVVPLLMLLSLSGIVEMVEALSRTGKGAGKSLAVGVGGLACLFVFASGLLGQRDFWNAPHDGYLSWANKGYSRDQRVLMGGWLLDRAVVVADWLNTNIPPGSVIAYSEMGVTPYLTPQLRYLDVDGLTDHGVATLPGVVHGQIGVQDDYIASGSKMGSYLRDVRKPDYIIRGTVVPKGQEVPLLPILDDAYTGIAAFPMPTNLPEKEGYMIVWKRAR